MIDDHHLSKVGESKPFEIIDEDSEDDLEMQDSKELPFDNIDEKKKNKIKKDKRDDKNNSLK